MRTILLLLLTLTLGLPAWSQPQPREAGTPGTPALELSPEQRASLKAIRDRYEDQRQDILVRLKARRVELAGLLRQDEVDKATVKAKLDEILQLEGERQTLFLNEMFAAKAQLKPGQWRAYRRQVFRSLLGR